MAISQDETLKGNEKIEEAILGLQKETSQEMLAHVLTVIRRRMNENGQVIVAVEMNPGNTQMAVNREAVTAVAAVRAAAVHRAEAAVTAGVSQR